MKLAVSVTVVLYAVLCTGAWAAGKLAPELEAYASPAARTEFVPVIISFHQEVQPGRIAAADRRARREGLITALQEQAAVTQSRVRGLLSQRGVTGMRTLWIINSLAATVPGDLLQTLASLPEVANVRPDRVVTLAATQTEQTSTGDGWNLSSLEADLLWAAGIDGQGAVVGVMDSGVDLHHADLSSRWRGQPGGWFDPYGEYSGPHDGTGHGTQVAGIVLGGSAGGVPIGMAPGARWIAAKIFRDDGTAMLSYIHQGFQWMLDPDGDPGSDDAPDVVNDSWVLLNSAGACDPEFLGDVQVLRAADIAVVFAAGNSGPADRTSPSPANYSESMAVGAVDETLTIAPFSSRGPSACDAGVYPMLTAPGVGIRTADLTFGGVFPNAYRYVTGTSFAAAHLSGGLALLRQGFPSAPVAVLAEAMMQSARDLGETGPDNAYGAGLVQVEKAYRLLLDDPRLQAPVAAGDFYSGDEDLPLSVAAPGVLANDTAPDGTALSAVLVDPVSHGDLVLNPDGSFDYQPPLDFSGLAAFSYKASGGSGESDAAIVSITVNPVNDAPQARDDSASTRKGRSVSISLTANDIDSEGELDPASVTLAAQPRKGTVTVNGDGSVTYTPVKGTGGDVFSYTVRDVQGAESNEAVVAVEIAR